MLETADLPAALGRIRRVTGLPTTRPARVEDYAAGPRIAHEYDAPVTAEGLRNAMRKLATHGRMETVVTARRLGFLP